MACCMEEKRLSWTAFSVINEGDTSLPDPCDSGLDSEVQADSEEWENFSFHKAEFSSASGDTDHNSRRSITFEEKKNSFSNLSKEQLSTALSRCFPCRKSVLPGTCHRVSKEEAPVSGEAFCTCTCDGLAAAAFQSRCLKHSDLSKSLDPWLGIHGDLGIVGPLKWKETSLCKVYKMVLDPSLTLKDKEDWEVAIENLELTDQSLYTDFHKIISARFLDSFRFRKDKDLQNTNSFSSANNDDSSSDTASLSDTISINSYGDVALNTNDDNTDDQLKELSADRNGEKGEAELTPKNLDHCRSVSPSEIAVKKKWKKIGVNNSKFDGRMAVKGLARLPLSELRTLHSELDRTCTEYSQVLIKELTKRDELIREKEIRDKFISLLLTIQRKQKESESLQSRRKLFSRTGNQEQKFLDTTIPYIPEDDGPNVGNIQKLTEILQAILNEDSKVPDMVTNYILKVIKAMQQPQKVS